MKPTLPQVRKFLEITERASAEELQELLGSGLLKPSNARTAKAVIDKLGGWAEAEKFLSRVLAVFICCPERSG